VCRLANWLRAQGVRVGDTVALYLPMVPALPMAMLACARIGAVHTVVFGGFSAEALAGRIVDSGARVLLTASGAMRGRKTVPLKRIADAACNAAARAGCQARSAPLHHPASPLRFASSSPPLCPPRRGAVHRLRCTVILPSAVTSTQKASIMRRGATNCLLLRPPLHFCRSHRCSSWTLHTRLECLARPLKCGRSVTCGTMR
jgi:acyl-CoA synthetase (AMP-forming)/AMP-acid ligase II